MRCRIDAWRRDYLGTAFIAQSIILRVKQWPRKSSCCLPGWKRNTYRRCNVCACRTIEIAQVPEAMSIKETRGVVKMTIDPKTEVIAGVHMLAPMAADLIHEAALAVKFKLTLNDIVDTVHLFFTNRISTSVYKH